MRSVSPKLIKLYKNHKEFKPFDDWFLDLDLGSRIVILERLFRIRRGVLGDYKKVGEYAREFRVHENPGYRIYFNFVGSSEIILLLGGDKGTQNRDIEKADEYYLDYREDPSGKSIEFSYMVTRKIKRPRA